MHMSEMTRARPSETVIVGSDPRTPAQWLTSLAGATAAALLVPVSMLLLGLPVALAVRGILDAAAWLLPILRP
jgi:fumarate reductase subunit D